MKVAAHPMLVAVALGLLGPNALATESIDESRTRRGSARAAHNTTGVEREAVMSALEDEEGPYWTRLSLVNDEADSWSTDEE